jgi:hypothetical protein
MDKQLLSEMDIVVEKGKQLSAQDMILVPYLLADKKDKKHYQNYAYIVDITDAIWRHIFVSVNNLKNLLECLPDSKSLEKSIPDGIAIIQDIITQHQKDWAGVNGIFRPEDKSDTVYGAKCTELLEIFKTFSA